jgi:hypothetical protein
VGFRLERPRTRPGRRWRQLRPVLPAHLYPPDLDCAEVSFTHFEVASHPMPSKPPVKRVGIRRLREKASLMGPTLGRLASRRRMSSSQSGWNPRSIPSASVVALATRPLRICRDERLVTCRCRSRRHLSSCRSPSPSGNGVALGHRRRNHPDRRRRGDLGNCAGGSRSGFTLAGRVSDGRVNDSRFPGSRNGAGPER